MKLRLFIFPFLFTILFANLLVAQTEENPILIKKFEGLEYGGDCPLISLTLYRKGEMNVKTFEFKVPVSGNYYVSAWIAGEYEKGILKDIFISADEDEKTKARLKLTKCDWQGLTLSKTIYFSSGTHHLSFESEGETVPAVDFIRISLDEKKVEINDNKYVTMIEEINGKNSSGKLNKISNVPYTTDPGTPIYDYAYATEQSVKYTYMLTTYLYNDQTYTFETSEASPTSTDPVMYVYQLSSTGAIVFHRSDDNTGVGNNAKITFDTPSNDPRALYKTEDVLQGSYYHVLIRAKSSLTEGTVKLARNTYAVWNNCPVNDVRHYCTNRVRTSSSSTFNYFTCNNDFDTKLFLEMDLAGQAYGTLVAYNNDNAITSDYSWGTASRIQYASDSDKLYAMVLPYSSYNITDSYDIYMKVEKKTPTGTFPLLKSNDSMVSHNATTNDIIRYNCFAWAGGICARKDAGTNYFVSADIRPKSNDYDWKDLDGDINSYDNYFGNVGASGSPAPRYEGAMNYVRTTDSLNAVLVLYTINNVTHAALKKTDYNLHGYAWESKFGRDGIRAFHAMNSLEGGDYGSITYYYIIDASNPFYSSGNQISATRPMTLDESISGGYSVLDDVSLSESEEILIDEMIKNQPKSIVNSFEEKFKKWESKTMYCNTDEDYLQSGAGDIISFCIENVEYTLPLLFKKSYRGEGEAGWLLNKITSSEFGHLKKDIVKETKKTKYDKKGAFIVRFSYHYNIRYIKKLLKLTDKWKNIKNTKLRNYENDISDYGGKEVKDLKLEQNYPNPANPSTVIRFSLPESSKISLIIYDILGEEICRLANNEVLEKGWHNISWNGRNSSGIHVPSGVYIYRLSNGTDVLSGKIIMMK